MFYLNKFIGVVISPIGIAILGGIGVLLCARFKRQRIAKLCGWLTVAWLWVWMTPIMTQVVGVTLEREFLVDGRVPAVETFPEADAIVLLGGAMGIETNLSSCAEMWTSADRVWQAARLYKAGKAPKVIATSGGVVETTFPLLRDFGLPEAVLMKVDDARNTEEEAKSVAKMDCRRILLVTSAWHMKRAKLIFEKYAPDLRVICAPADFENTLATARPLASWQMFLPDPKVFGQNSVAAHEWIGLLGYKLLR